MYICDYRNMKFKGRRNNKGVPMNRDQVLAKIAGLQKELSELMQLVLTGNTSSQGMTNGSNVEARPEEAAHEDEKSPEAPEKKTRWKYVDGTQYQIVGSNPFRSGTNYLIFDALQGEFGHGVFAVSDVKKIVTGLVNSGEVVSRQGIQQLMLVFLRSAGPMKGRLAMVDAAEGPISVEALPPEAGEQVFKLVGASPFRRGINLEVWSLVEGQNFSRSQLEQMVGVKVMSGEFVSKRNATVIVRDFLTRVRSRELIQQV